MPTSTIKDLETQIKERFSFIDLIQRNISYMKSKIDMEKGKGNGQSWLNQNDTNQ